MPARPTCSYMCHLSLALIEAEIDYRLTMQVCPLDVEYAKRGVSASRFTESPEIGEVVFPYRNVAVMVSGWKLQSSRPGRFAAGKQPACLDSYLPGNE